MNCNKLPDIKIINSLHDLYEYNESFDSNDILGSGVSSDVYKVIKKSDKKLYALKIETVPTEEDLEDDEDLIIGHEIITKLMISEMIIGNYIKELGLEKHVITPNVCYEVNDKHLKYYAIEYDLIVGQTLDKSPALLSSAMIAANMYVLFNVMLILHMNGIYHNDIKPENIIFSDRYGRFILLDLGSACSSSCKPDDLSYCQYLGDVRYQHPDLIRKKPITNEDRAKNDIYGLIKTYSQAYPTHTQHLHSHINMNVASINYALSDNVPDYYLIKVIELYLPYLSENNLEKLLNQIQPEKKRDTKVKTERNMINENFTINVDGTKYKVIYGDKKTPEGLKKVVRMKDNNIYIIIQIDEKSKKMKEFEISGIYLEFFWNASKVKGLGHRVLCELLREMLKKKIVFLTDEMTWEPISNVDPNSFGSLEDTDSLVRYYNRIGARVLNKDYISDWHNKIPVYMSASIRKMIDICNKSSN